MFLLPPAKHLCQECAHDHKPDAPHNAQTMFYQVKFKMDHGREPTWADAWAHCTPKVQDAWRKGLTDIGIDIDAGQISPTNRRAKA